MEEPRVLSIKAEPHLKQPDLEKEIIEEYERKSPKKSKKLKKSKKPRKLDSFN